MLPELIEAHTPLQEKLKGNKIEYYLNMKINMESFDMVKVVA